MNTLLAIAFIAVNFAAAPTLEQKIESILAKTSPGEQVREETKGAILAWHRAAAEAAELDAWEAELKAEQLRASKQVLGQYLKYGDQAWRVETQDVLNRVADIAGRIVSQDPATTIEVNPLRTAYENSELMFLSEFRRDFYRLRLDSITEESNSLELLGRGTTQQAAALEQLLGYYGSALQLCAAKRRAVVEQSRAAELLIDANWKTIAGKGSVEQLQQAFSSQAKALALQLEVGRSQVAADSAALEFERLALISQITQDNFNIARLAAEKSRLNVRAQQTALTLEYAKARAERATAAEQPNSWTFQRPFADLEHAVSRSYSDQAALVLLIPALEGVRDADQLALESIVKYQAVLARRKELVEATIGLSDLSIWKPAATEAEIRSSFKQLIEVELARLSPTDLEFQRRIAALSATETITGTGGIIPLRSFSRYGFRDPSMTSISGPEHIVHTAMEAKHEELRSMMEDSEEVAN